MSSYIITEINLAANIYRSGILKYFSNKNLVFYMTDICYDNDCKSPFLVNDRIRTHGMIDSGMLKIARLTEDQMAIVFELHAKYKPKFRPKTISSLVLASEYNLKLVSEDELLREIASKDLHIKAYDKERLISDLVLDIKMMGIPIELELVKDLI